MLAWIIYEGDGKINTESKNADLSLLDYLLNSLDQVVIMKLFSIASTRFSRSMRSCTLAKIKHIYAMVLDLATVFSVPVHLISFRASSNAT